MEVVNRVCRMRHREQNLYVLKQNGKMLILLCVELSTCIQQTTKRVYGKLSVEVPTHCRKEHEQYKIFAITKRFSFQKNFSFVWKKNSCMNASRVQILNKLLFYHLQYGGPLDRIFFVVDVFVEKTINFYDKKF